MRKYQEWALKTFLNFYYIWIMEKKKTLYNSPTIFWSQDTEIFLLFKNLKKIKKTFSQPLYVLLTPKIKKVFLSCKIKFYTLNNLLKRKYQDGALKIFLYFYYIWIMEKQKKTLSNSPTIFWSQDKEIFLL